MDGQPPPALTPSQQALLDTWQRHTLAEFVEKDVEAALATMTEDPYVLMVPTATGGFGREGVRRFYATAFIPQLPPDIEATPVSQIVGADRLVEEAIYSFTHSVPMDFMLPAIPPTGRRVEVAVVGIIQFRDGKVANEHLYWDQASVLVQLDLLDASTPAVAGARSARTLLTPSLLSSEPARR